MTDKTIFLKDFSAYDEGFFIGQINKKKSGDGDDEVCGLKIAASAQRKEGKKKIYSMSILINLLRILNTYELILRKIEINQLCAYECIIFAI